MVPVVEKGTTILKAMHIPAVAVVKPCQKKIPGVDQVLTLCSPYQVVMDHCPSDKLGIKSVQMVEEKIIPMSDMKMSWVPWSTR